MGWLKPLLAVHQREVVFVPRMLQAGIGHVRQDVHARDVRGELSQLAPCLLGAHKEVEVRICSDQCGTDKGSEIWLLLELGWAEVNARENGIRVRHGVHGEQV